MFLQFTGLSLLVHILVIIFAKIFNYVRGQGEKSAFQTYHKHGGMVRSAFSNRIISLCILLFMFVYMTLLASIALVTAEKMGETEPQVMYAKSLAAEAMQSTNYYSLLQVLVFITVGVFFLFYASTVKRTYILVSQWIVAQLFEPLVSVFSKKHLFVIVKSVKSVPKVLWVTVFKPIISTRSINTIFRSFFLFLLLLGASLAFLAMPTPVQAQIVEPGFESEVVATDLSLATAVAFTNDGRIFIAEKGGTIKVVKNGVMLPTPLITLTDVNTFGDRGLLGLAVDPNFAQNGYIYVSYTFENTPGLNIAGAKTGHIARLTVVGDIADESSKVVIIGSVGGSALAPSCVSFATTADCVASDSPSHSMGGLRFGLDGKLYATIGDGADFTDVDPRALRAQNLDSLNGKMLRINTDGTAPVDNPFYNGNVNANRSKVYALGLRNAFRFNFNTVTGKLYAGDVGWSSWEEINLVTAGSNYGWPCREGNVATSYGCTPSTSTTNPLYTYAHNSGGAGSITGGAFFGNGAYPTQYATSLFIGDYAQMWMKRLVLNAAGTAVVSVENFIPDSVWPVDILAGSDGNVYYIDIVQGTLNRLTHTSGNRRPVVALSATPNSGLVPLSVTFSSVGTSDPDGDALTYLWNFGDAATSSLANPSHTYTQNGTYLAVLSVTDSRGATVAQNQTITAGNQKPDATIVTPSSGALYHPLEQVTVTGAGVDPELGNLPASAFSWVVKLHHNTHVHTLQQFTNTKTITFTADDHNATDVYLEIILTVTDSAALTDTQSINMYLDNGVGSGNLVSNSSLETVGTLPGSPLNWYQGWYGLLNPIFTYPVTGLAGASAASIQVTSYTSGSAKWFFSPAFVSPGKTYNFSDLYTATVPTVVTVQFGKPDGTYQYQYISTVPATSTVTRTNFSFVVPAGIETATVFHEIDAVGTLVVDDYSLTLAGTGDVTPPTGSITSPINAAVISGTVSVAITANDNVGVGTVHLAVDGVETGVGDTEAPYSIFLNTTTLTDGAHTLTAHIHDAAGNAAETAPVSVTVTNATTTHLNLITNGNFEIANGANPLGWNKGGWGTHTRVHTYPVPGATGVGAEVAITKYDLSDTGDAKWQFADVNVTPGVQYTYESMYKSNTVSDVIGRYTMSDGTYHYFGIIKELPPLLTWTHIQNTFVPPVGAVSVTFFHLISSVGVLTIDDVTMYISGSGVPSETNPPLIAFVTPSANATVSGLVTMLATSSDDTSVSGVYFAVNGTFQGTEDVVAPYQTIWNTTLVPDGVYILKATAHDPFGNNDKTEITVTVNNTLPPTDTTKPTVSVTQPLSGTTASGTLGVQVTASDNVAVTGVTLLIDGVVVGVQDTTAPYTFSWNTTGVTNGAHTISARAVDAAGNSQDAVAVSITVNNSVVTPPTNNLVLNPALEIAGTAGNPQNWNRGGWGTNNRIFTYPVAGVTGNAAQIDITTYTNGDAKWYFDPVAVTQNTQYTVSDKYKATVSSEILARYTLAGGAFSYQFLATLPATAGAWNTFSQSITTPASTTAITLFHVLPRIGTLSIDDVAVLGAVVNPPTDTTKPTVSVTQPLSGTTASGTLGVQVTATDNVAVTGVTLLVDGGVVGTADTASPYTFTFDTTSVINGAHTISARAVDAAGNSQDAANVSVTVNNTVVTPPPTNNLILNPAFEIAGTAGNPQNWNRGGWGTNNRIFTYPVAGVTGNAAQIDITTYTNGDAKWYFDPVLVNPGETYSFSYSYKSSTTTNITLRYTLADGTFTYLGVSNPVAAANWTNGSFTFIPPAGATAVSVMHIINRVGFLTIDNYALSSGNTHTFSRGKVSLSFDDGWLEHATLVRPVLDTAAIKGTFYIISDEMAGATPTERVANSSLETAGTGGDPQNWNRGGWGTNDRTYTYPVAGVSGNAVQVAITSYTNGDAKWFANDVFVATSTKYTIGDKYKSNVSTEILARFTLSDGTFFYQFLSQLPATAGAWNTFSQTITTPANAVSITLFHVIAGVGTLAIDEMSVKPVQVFATTAQVQTLAASGHEIGAHSRTHPSLTTLGTSGKTAQISGSRQDLLNAGFAPVSTFAYPYGDYDTEVQTITQNAGFTLGRSVIRGYNDTTTDHYALKIQQVSRDRTLAEMKGWVDQAALDHTWLIFMFHQVSDDSTNSPLGITPADFQSLVSYVKTANVDKITVAEGATLLQ